MNEAAKAVIASKWSDEAGSIMLSLINKGYSKKEGLAILAIVVGTICYDEPEYRDSFDKYIEAVIKRMSEVDDV